MPKIYHPFICGGHNERLQQLIQEAGGNVRINVPPPSVAKDEITIAGEKDGVQMAKDRIVAIHKEMVCSLDFYLKTFEFFRFYSS